MQPRWLVSLCLTALLVVLLNSSCSGRFWSSAWSLRSQPSDAATPLFTAKLPPVEAIAFPADAGYVNVKDFGAKGDGVTDDTAALKAVLGRGRDRAIRAIYIPNGTYLVSDTLAWGDKRKDVWGQSRDGVVIKLKDNCPGFQNAKQPKKVLQVEYGHGGQNFDQRLHNLTVDVGAGNPGAIGIGFHTNNSGGIEHVVIRSSDPHKRGHTGLSLDKAWPGPGYIQGVYVDGFETGIYITHDQYSMTLEHISLTNQRQVGLVNVWNTVAIRDLKSQNRVPAIENRGDMGLMALVDSELVGGDRSLPAIVNHQNGVLFARDIKTHGYVKAIENRSGPAQDVAGPLVEEFSSHPVSTLFPGMQRSLRLPIQDPPAIPYGNPKNWASVTAFGAKPNDKDDDGAAIQRAIDSGAEVVYFPAGLYLSTQTIQVRGNLRRLMGLDAKVEFKVPGRPAFVVEDGQPSAVAIDVRSTYTNQSSYWVEHASKRTLVLRNGSYINTVPGGNVFIEDTSAVPFVFDRQNVWMRQINTESYDHNPHIINKGSKVWILGLKTEKDRTIIGTYAGGRTEVIGGLLYKNRERLGPAPAFISENSAISLTYRNKGLPYQTQVLEKHQGATREFQKQSISAAHSRVALFVGSDGQ